MEERNSNLMDLKFSEAGFVLSAMFDRKKEIMNLNPNGNTNIDPFYLLKEVAQMSNLRN